ncbi:uncharacterized protein FTJAE_5423 [Fusarium tjaetaba]|uniref:Pt repeat family protein n=1 Tax=Fusarium tjaetaba TaxID=1567544 RepID=A0A8H5RRL3_9HYPO|nr:uncharacterized protein FTJAE_5423 [Fusarium tjaetaba]KAF5638322.1 hypothetical protein FTJAE_5423 [Fusarium tjaetaba]
MPLRRSSNSADGHSVTSSPSFSLSSTKRRFPLLSRRRNRHSDVSQSSIPPLPSPSPPASPSPSQKVAKPGLRVHVQVKFESPHSSEHVRDYEASAQLKATDRICQALLSRLQHCSSELITRHDSNALDPLRKPHRDVKPLRYRITYRVERDGLILVEKSLRSFQEYELTHDDAREVVAATDRIIGLFLVRHDPGFQWSESVESETTSPETETFRPCTGRPQSMACIPRSHFVSNTQKFEFVSGYSIELFLRSRCATRYPENRNASIKIDSRQPSPLPLLLGEELTTRVSNLIIDPVDAWKRKFDKRHKSCAGLEGSGGCTHIEDGAVDIMVKVRNHIGPDYTYFSHRIQTSKVLFNDHDGRDFDEFANQVKAKLEKARDMTDKSVRSLDDFTLTIRELRGKNWSVHEPLIVRLDPTVTYCRQTMEAVMERLQTGISNVLEHHEDALATMTVHKRGHLIFDGFLDGAGGDDSVHHERFATPDLERKALEAHLKERIRSDITMLCRDTCAIDCPDTLPNLRLKTSGSAASSIGATQLMRPPLSTAGSSSAAPTTPSLAASLPRQPSEKSFHGSMASTRSDLSLTKKLAKESLRDPVECPSAPATPSPDMRRVPSGVEMAKKHGYMSDFMADDENQSEPPSTPSLVDTDSLSPRDSVVATPSRAMPHDQSNEGLRIIDDGRRIIYQEQSDMDAIASGMVQFHRPITDDDELIQLVKEKPAESPDKKATRRSLDTRMPDLSGNTYHLREAQKHEPVITQESQPHAPVTPGLQKAMVAEELSTVSVAEQVPGLGVPVPGQTKAEAITEKATGETHQAFQEQWETVEARDKPRENPTEVEANSKSETSFGTTPEASIREDAETKDISTPDVAVTVTTEERPSDEKQIEAQLSNDSEVQTPKAEPVVSEKSKVSLADAAQKTLEASVLGEFPKPPSIHADTDEAGRDDPQKEHGQETLIQTLVSDLRQVEEDQEVITSRAPNGAPTSSDSGISMEGDAKDREAQSPAATELTENTSLPSKKTDDQSSVKADVIGKDEQHIPHSDVTDEHFPEMVTHFLETVPEDTLLEPTEVVAEDVEIVTSNSPKTPEEPTPLEEPTLMPTIASAPPENLLTPDNFFSSLSEEKEKGQDYPRKPFDTSEFADALARPRVRPRTATLPERRYSTALTLEIDLNAHCDPDQEHSPTEDAPKSASGTWRRDGLHRRQPSAGFIGLPDQRRLHSVGLRSAVLPYRWQQMRREQALWEGRPGTSHSEA